MDLTILKVGEVPAPLRDRFPTYPEMFAALFAEVGARFSTREIDIVGGAPLPDTDTLQGVLITGSPAGVYDDEPWIAPLRAFIARAHARALPMVGVCYGHQAIADALGGVVEKSDKGWGLGRHAYAVSGLDDFAPEDVAQLAVTCSHQDQVIVPPPGATTVLASPFAPHAGLRYDNGTTLSVQPHPEFADDYGKALAQARRGRASDAVVDAALASFAIPSDRLVLAQILARFLETAMADAPARRQASLQR